MIELVQGKNHQVIKRDGKIEYYNSDKMKQVLMWACNNKEYMVDEILEDINLKVFDKISINKLFDEVIETVANKISELTPIWDDVAKNLFLQKIYKETWGIKRNEYPYYGEVLKKGVQYGVYNKDIINSFSEEEIKQLNDIIIPSQDFTLDYLGLRVFVDKQSKRYTTTKILELPQHGFMRLAMFAFWKEPKNIRINLIETRYKNLSNYHYSEATPKWINSMSYHPQMASCVVSKIPDDSEGINKTISNLGLFSKHGGGLAGDVSALRCTNSRIGKSGKSSGPVPFIKLIESIVSAYNQNGKRPGAFAAYFPWWHYDVEDLIELKEEGGTEDRRARKLQYGIKWNKLFTERIQTNKEITLFDPKETPELLETHGEEFNKWYLHYEAKAGIRKKKIEAVDLAFNVAKQRIETGNIYIFFEENVQTQNNFNDRIYSSNLCTEIFLSTKSPIMKKSSLLYDMSEDKTTLVEESDPGLIALCNLSSVNLIVWDKLTEQEKEETIYNLLRASDNLINYAYYPAKEGEIFNRNYRAIGVGVTNYTQLLASKGLGFESKESLKFTNDTMESIYWYLMKANIKLAQERGRFTWFDKTKYAKGEFCFDNYTGPINFDLNYDWESLRIDLRKSGARFATVSAIAPTATSSLIMKSTEGIEPIRQVVSMKTGTYNCKQLAPNLTKYRTVYESAWDLDSTKMIDLASIRQKWIDQGQSFSLYYKDRNESAFEILYDILYAEKMGLKSLYYAHTPQDDEDIENCESCSV